MSLIKNKLLNTYKRLPVSFERGSGAWLSDRSGNKYLDGLSGVAVNTLGHNHLSGLDETEYSEFLGFNSGSLGKFSPSHIKEKVDEVKCLYDCVKAYEK